MGANICSMRTEPSTVKKPIQLHLSAKAEKKWQKNNAMNLSKNSAE